jgi:hypothetical protein
MVLGNRKNLAIRPFFMLLTLALLNVATPALSDHERMHNQLTLFKSFLQNHPKISADLRANPKLVNNKKYLDKHEELSKFLKRHPSVKRELVNHPSHIFGNYYRSDQAHLTHNR